MRRRTLAKSLLAGVLLAGCSTASRQATGEASRTYVNPELHVSFQVPAGWTESKPWNPFDAAPYVARFDSPAGEDTLILGQAQYAGTNCPVAASGALRSSSGAAFASERQFALKTARGEVPAGRGQTSIGNRAGEAGYFCYGHAAVVLEASTSRQEFANRRGELEGIADTLTFDADGAQVAVRAPAGPPPLPTFFVYAVKFRGQTLGQIAEWYTGTYDNWRKIARVNTDLSLPNVPLKVGREVKIPTEIVVRRDPLPEPKPKHIAPKTSPKHAKPSAEEVAPAEPHEAPAPEGAPALPPVIGPR
jgi:hypothetical protein